ncbi:MAG TPA: HD domain-containing phosphohydrolase [Vicinamibacterales bacterium]
MRPALTPQVLVVEPDPALQTAVAAWLEGAGYECLAVSDADEALAIAQEDEADVALISSRVPAWSPAHLAAALQSRDTDLPVIVVREDGNRGGHGSLPVRRAAVEEIAAPLTRGSVMGALSRALEWREASDEERARYRELQKSVAGQVALVREACIGEPCTAAGLTTAFTTFLDRRIPGSKAHADRVSALAVSLATAIGMDDAARHTLTQAAALHELGVALLPQALRRPVAELRGLERVLARRHPEIVAELLSPLPALADAATLIHAAHERFDGSGYPRGLRGLEIPMGSRIIALACGVDRLVQGHGAEPALDQAAAGAALVQSAGSAYDPDLVRVWLSLSDRAAQRACH